MLSCRVHPLCVIFRSPLDRRSGEPRLHRHKDLEQQQQYHHGPQHQQQQQQLHHHAGAAARAPTYNVDEQQESSLLHPSPPHTHTHTHRYRGLLSAAPPVGPDGDDVERGAGGPA